VGERDGEVQGRELIWSPFTERIGDAGPFAMRSNGNRRKFYIFHHVHDFSVVASSMHQTFIRDQFCVFTEQYRSSTTEEPFQIGKGIYSAHPIDQIDGLYVFFTGVIYNLAECAAIIKTDSNDPRQIIARLFRAKCDELPILLEGSYAIVIVSADRVMAFRDNFGIENLYYSIDQEKGSFILASSIAEIRKYVPLRVNQRVLPKYFLFQQLNGSETFFEGISIMALRELRTCALPMRLWTSAKYDGLPYRPMNPKVGDDQTIITKTEDRLRRVIQRFHDFFPGFSWINSYSGGTDSSLQAVLLKELGHLTAYTTCHAHEHGDDVEQ